MLKPTKLLCVGPGGRKCPCCFPPRGSAARKAQFRGVKRALGRDLREVVRQDTGMGS